MGRAGSSTMANKTTPSEVNPKTKVSGSPVGVVHGLEPLHMKERYIITHILEQRM
jgi:hypothetical protein